MLLSQLLEDSRYLTLTEKQKVFVRTYCETQDLVKAGHLAWNTKGDDSRARQLGQQFLAKNSGASQLIGKFIKLPDDRVTREEMLSKLGQRFKLCTDDKLVLEYSERISKIEGWDTKAAPPIPKEQTGVWNLVAEMEK